MEGFLDYIQNVYQVVPCGNGDNVQLRGGECPFCGCSKQDLRVYYNIRTDRGICHHCGRGFNACSFFAARERVSMRSAKASLSDEDVYRRTFQDSIVSGHCPYPSNTVSAKAEEPFKYLSGRNVLAETIDDFGIEFCPDDFIWNNRPVYVHDRVIFPISDETGVVSWQGRDITGLNPQKYFFPKGFKSAEYLYNYQNINSNNYIILAEGVMDVIGWHQAGFRNVVGTFGKKISQYQLNMILKKKPRVVYQAWDSDAENNKYTFAQKNQHLFPIKIIDLQGKDADELSKKQLCNYFDNAQDYSWSNSMLTLLH